MLELVDPCLKPTKINTAGAAPTGLLAADVITFADLTTSVRVITDPTTAYFEYSTILMDGVSREYGDGTDICGSRSLTTTID